MSILMDEEMKIRVPAWMKAGFQRLAGERLTSEAQLARQAFLEFMERENLKSVNSSKGAVDVGSFAKPVAEDCAGKPKPIQTQPTKRQVLRRSKERRPAGESSKPGVP